MKRFSHAVVTVFLAAIPFCSFGQGQGAGSVHALAFKADGMNVHVPYPTGWSVGSRQLRNGYDLFSAPADKLARPDLTQLGHVLVSYEKYQSHAEVLRQLKNIAAEESASLTYLGIGGWPAIQRRFVAPVGQPGEEELEVALYELRVTTAIAAGTQLVRVEARIPLAAPTSVADEAQAIGQTITFSQSADAATIARELKDIQTPPARSPAIMPAGPEKFSPAPKSTSSSSATPGAVAISSSTDLAAPGLAGVAYPGVGEFEVAASPSGRNIVVAGNSGAVVSGNGGSTFANAIGIVQNDVSMAVGVSGNFYAASIGSAPGSNTTRIARSADGGTNFVFTANAVACSTNGPGCTLPDQEHIAADRVNIAPGGGDQVYSVWRNCTPGCLGALVTFSTDSGVTWSAPVSVDGGGDFPRITVGQDGSVYVVYAIGGSRDGIRIKRYSSAASGFALQSTFDVAATGNSNVPCPVPGLDRCNDGNVLASPMAAVDDTNPQHVYVSYANNTAAGNEDVFVRDSTDSGATFPAARVVRLNSLVNARRYLPWIGAVGGAARVSWYDRRASAASIDNSLSDFYSGSAFLDAGNNLVAGSEFKVSPVPDSNCLSGWPCSPRSTNDSESCSIQPQNAGNCSNTATKCDFSSPTNCAAGVACFTGGGCPKYGDYNGIAAAAGRVFNAWDSATNPQGVRNGFTVYFASKIVCCVPQLQVPGTVSLPTTCVGKTNVATLLVCNTGKTDLEVGTITSSSTEVRVVPPSSGYPVIVSPDFCFPFQVSFAPTTVGAKSATLTVPSDDPVSPSVTVLASGEAAQQRIATSIADGGRFGNVCIGTFKDLDVVINNSGGCDLIINNITSSSPEFKTATVMSFPLVVQAGTSMHTPIRLEPTSLGVKSANITITSNDPTTPTKVIMVSGNTPPGSLRLTGSTDFGDVCAGVLAEKQLAVCNVGTCNLNVSSIAFVPSCTEFTLINNPFPAAVSPDSCQNVTIRFTPTSCGAKSCTLRIITDDPNALTNNVTVTANAPCASIDVPPDVCFPPTVIQSVGACSSLKPFPISNTGTCPLKITAITLGGANPGAYLFSGLPSFPILLEQGHIVGEGNFKIGFIPTVLARDTLATVSVTYESDPVSHATTTVTRTLNGEGVRTGARVLVLGNGVPLAKVEKIMIQRITGNRNRPLLDTVESAMNLSLTTVTPTPPCGPFQYHREYSTVSNPIQLLPGSYQITATAYVGTKKYTKAIGFDVQTCTFNPNIVISLP